MRLDHLPQGRPARLIAFHDETETGGRGRLVRRLRELGMDEGVTVTILHHAAFGDPIVLAVEEVEIALRRAEAATVEVEPLDTPRAEADA